MLRIALPNKGRLSEDVRELFNDAGLTVKVRGDRALTASLGGEFEAIFVRAQDIPELVADGAADAGVTGWDLVNESGRELSTLLDLEFGRCRLVVAAREESGVARLEDVPDGARVATSFPKLTARFFAERGRNVTVVPVSGACEIAPHVGIADIITDLTSTGSTLKMNGLHEVVTMLTSSARLVANPQRSADASAKLEELTVALGSVLAGRNKRYLMANCTRDQLPRVRDILPGLTGPTVVDILNGGNHVAVHAVVAADQVYRTTSALKAVGCTGILVTRIERLIP